MKGYDWKLDEQEGELVMTVYRDWRHIPLSRRRLLRNGFMFVSLVVAPFLYLTMLRPLVWLLRYNIPFTVSVEGLLCAVWFLVPIIVYFAPMPPLVWRFGPQGVRLGGRNFVPGDISSLRLRRRRTRRKGSGPSDVADVMEHESRWLELEFRDRKGSVVYSRLFDETGADALNEAVERIAGYLRVSNDSEAARMNR